MKALMLVGIVAMAAAGGWFAARKFNHASSVQPTGGRKIAYYQSPMHPWITSKAPGRCTICGMNLEPVFEGERGFAADEGVVMLGSNSIQAINVESVVVTNRPLIRTLRVAGVIEGNESAQRRLSAYAEGRVEKLLVNYVGAEVTAGQPLAVFYSPSLLAAESEYLVVANQKLSGAVSDSFQEERGRMLAAASQRLKRLGYSDAQIAALARKDAADARTEVLAPMTGTVVARNVYEGQYVKEGDLLFEISDFSTMWFQFEAYERDLSWLKNGLTVDVTTAALPGRIFSAPIRFIDPNLNEMTRSARVRVELPNPLVEENGRKQRRLLRKMFAEGAVKIETPNVLVVPRSAVLSAGAPVVYVDLGGGAYEQRQVRLGRVGDEDREVLEGVVAGERVVTTGNLIIDAQAQLNTLTGKMKGSAAKVPTQSQGAATNSQGLVPPGLNEAQQQIAREFLQLTSDLGNALAGDDLNRYNEIASRVHAVIPKVIDSFGPVKSMRPALLKIEEMGHLEKAKDLAAARKAFLPFSMSAVELARQLRTTEPFKGTRVFNCPMVNRAIPGAAKNGQWIQLQPPLRNPFFGAEMIDCGTEVK